MMPTRIFFSLLLLLPSLSIASESHCATGETVAFSCSVGSKTVSVCVTGDGTNNVQYRFGALGSREISYPESRAGGNQHVRSGYVLFAAGDARYIRFTNRAYEYVVYEGAGRGWAQEGLAVLKDGNVISSKQCVGPIVSAFAAASSLEQDSDEVALAKWDLVPMSSD